MIDLRFRSGLTFFFLVGAILPIVTFVANRKWPNSIVKYVNFPIMFNGATYIPPASAYNYVPWVIVGFIFNYLIRRRHFSWWTKYNCKSRGIHFSFPRSWLYACRCIISGIGFWCGYIDSAYLLLLTIPTEWFHWGKQYQDVVGCVVFAMHQRVVLNRLLDF